MVTNELAMINLNLSFKGKRNYITGADLVTEINAVVKKLLGDEAWVGNIKFRGFAATGCFIVLHDDHSDYEDRVRGEFTVNTADESLKGLLIEDFTEVASRIPYDESLIVGNLSLAAKSNACFQKSQYSTIDDIVSLTKALHNELYPLDNGQWVFLQLDLDSPLPESYQNLEVSLKKVLNQRFSVSNITVDGVKIGTLRFSVAER